MAAKEEILRRLRESGGYVSGAQLSEQFGVTRAAVWKNICALRNDGYRIDSGTNRGYRFVSGPDVYSREEISSGLGTEWLGRTVFSYDTLDSTNEQAKRSALEGAPNGSIFISEEQIGGKGRLGRSFASPTGTGMWFSVLLRPGSLPVQVAATTLLAGLAVCGALRSTTGCDASLKWPNDVVIGTKKVCGILTEMSAEMERLEFVVIGIGVNVNIAAFPEKLREKATSVLLETGKPVRRVALLQEILRRLEKLLAENAEALTPAFLKEYRACCVTLGRKVTFQRRGEVVAGKAESVSPAGELIVRLPGGNLETVFSGEVSVQGFYGQKII